MSTNTLSLTSTVNCFLELAPLQKYQKKNEDSTVCSVATAVISTEIQNANAIKYQMQRCSIDHLDNNLTRLVFTFLDTLSLGKCPNVKRHWKVCSAQLLGFMDLNVIFPTSQFIFLAHWKNCVNLSFLEQFQTTFKPRGGNSALIPILNRLTDSIPIVGDSGFTFLTMPKGLTLDILLQFSEKRLGGVRLNIFSDIRSVFGQYCIEETYQIAISNNLVKGSIGLTNAKREDLLNNYRISMPSLLETVAFLIASDMHQIIYPFSECYICCKDCVFDLNVMVGGGSKFSGINIMISNVFQDIDFGDSNEGILAAIRIAND